MPPKVQRERRNAVSVTGIAVGLLAAALSAYMGFLAGLHHSGALVDTYLHPAAASTREAAASPTTNATGHSEDALAAAEARAAKLEAMDSQYVTFLRGENTRLVDAMKVVQTRIPPLYFSFSLSFSLMRCTQTHIHSALLCRYKPARSSMPRETRRTAPSVQRVPWAARI
jgi:hypothetical protein